jgi:hypothetical protein
LSVVGPIGDKFLRRSERSEVPQADKRRVSLVIAGSLAGTTTDLRTGRIVLALQARSGKTFAIAKRNHPRKISHVADAVEKPGI